MYLKMSCSLSNSNDHRETACRSLEGMEGDLCINVFQFSLLIVVFLPSCEQLNAEILSL